MSATNAVQAFIVQTLLNDAGVSAIVADRVWDDVPSNPILPYCAMGTGYHIPADAECVSAREYTFQVECWSQQQGQREEVNRLIDAMFAALHNATGDIGADYSLHSFRVTLTRVFDEENDEKRGILQIDAAVEVL